MLERLIELLISVWREIVPCVVIDCYQRGLVLRLGVFHRDLEPGLHWRIPLVDRLFYGPVIPNTKTLEAFPLTTKDNKSVSVEPMLAYEIEDFRKLMLEVQDKDEALYDITGAIIAEEVLTHTWDEIRQAGFTHSILIKARRKAKIYGIKLTDLQFTGLQLTRSLTIRQG